VIPAAEEMAKAIVLNMQIASIRLQFYVLSAESGFDRRVRLGRVRIYFRDLQRYMSPTKIFSLFAALHQFDTRNALNSAARFDLEIPFAPYFRKFSTEVLHSGAVTNRPFETIPP
jgi:hypothetical protein